MWKYNKIMEVNNMEKEYYNKYSVTDIKFIIEEVRGFYIKCPVAIMTTEKGLSEGFMKPANYGQFRMYKYEDNKDADSAYSDMVNFEVICYTKDPRPNELAKISSWDDIIRSLMKSQALLALHRFDTKGIDYDIIANADRAGNITTNIVTVTRQFVTTNQSAKKYILSMNGKTFRFFNLFELFIRLCYDYFKTIGSLDSGLYVVKIDSVPDKQYLVLKKGIMYNHICDFYCTITDDKEGLDIDISTPTGYSNKRRYAISAVFYSILTEHNSIPCEITDRSLLEKAAISRCIAESLNEVSISKNICFALPTSGSGITTIPIKEFIDNLAKNADIGI